MNLLHKWFVYLFDERKNEKGFVKCFECGKYMHEDGYKDLSTCYSHILNKKVYSQYKGEGWNVKIVHPECHQLFELYPEKAKQQQTLYLKLIKLHNKNKL